MNAKTLEAITRHGNTLLAAFPNAIERDPVTLCKKLRRIETAAHYAATQYCNGDLSSEKMDAETEHALKRVCKLLGIYTGHHCGLFVNRDPRGYALKISDDYRRYLFANGINLYGDMGGYGILAPDLNQ